VRSLTALNCFAGCSTFVTVSINPLTAAVSDDSSHAFSKASVLVGLIIFSAADSAALLVLIHSLLISFNLDHALKVHNVTHCHIKASKSACLCSGRLSLKSDKPGILLINSPQITIAFQILFNTFSPSIVSHAVLKA